MSQTPYTPQFFDSIEAGSRQSASATLPVLFSYVQPKSVVDVGCGTGAWLREFKEAGVADYLGIDGDYVDRAKLLIEPDRFLARNLAEPLEVGRRFDLAMSLEVGEHLPDAAADTFVASLARLAPVVLFSAAIPYQLGTDHINEQWPEYWRERFKRLDYVVVDCLRPRLWHVPSIEYWYRQNMMIYVERARLGEYKALAAAHAAADPHASLARVHPDFYMAQQKFLHGEIHSLRRRVLAGALRLRPTSLLAFPDWSLSDESLKGQLQAMLSAVAAHPERKRISLIVDASREKARNVSSLIHSAGTLLPDAIKTFLQEGPDISTIDKSFDPTQWPLLVTLVTCRLAMPGDDARAVAATGADRMRSVTLEQLAAKQPLATP